MRTETVGRTEVRVTSLGLGTAQLGDLYGVMPSETAAAIVDAAWAGGIRYFDTAPHYGLGLAESRLGAALARRDRSSYTVSTKVGRLIVETPRGPERRWDFSAAGVRRSLEESLERLGLERVDIVLVHDPEGHADAALDEAVPELARLRAAGTIGAVGVGSGDIRMLERFASEADVDAVMVAGRLTLLDQTALRSVVPACRERGVSILNAGVFNTGLTASPWPADHARYEYERASAELLARARRIAEGATRRGTTLPQAALKYAASERAVASVVVGADSPHQIEESIAMMDDDSKPEGLWAALAEAAP
jgi:D-threo-aldose 1-dehydrogenase